MNLHEYQAKQLFREYNMPVPAGEIAWNVEEALSVASQIGGDRWVVKAQVHAGGRGKAGGVKLVSNKEELAATAKALLGTHLVTYQTDEHGQPVHQVLIEQPCQIARELYLSAVLDRSSRRIMVMASTEGGVEIEKVAEATPEKILKFSIDPLVGIQPYQAREIGFKLNLDLNKIKEFTQILTGLGKLFVDCDLSLVEINPLVVTADGKLL